MNALAVGESRALRKAVPFTGHREMLCTVGICHMKKSLLNSAAFKAELCGIVCM
jgi:hypothetical protein